MSANTAARPYAEALFDLAQANHSVSVWAQWLSVLSETFSDPSLLRVVESPSLSTDARVKLFSEGIPDAIQAQAQRFLSLLFCKKRFNLITEIAQQFRHLVNNKTGCLEVNVTSAFELSSEQKDHFKRMLEKVYPLSIKLHCSTESKLIGGVRMKMGDQVIDASIRGKLERLSRRVTKA